MVYIVNSFYLCGVCGADLRMSNEHARVHAVVLSEKTN